MCVGGKVNYVDKIDVDLFNVDELHMFLQDLGYDPKQLMFYHYKLPNKSLDYGLRLLSCDADAVSLINLAANCKIEELDDDVLLNALVVGSSKRLALGFINEADVGESSVDENINENVNVDGNVDENVNENMNAGDEYEQDNVEDEEVRGNDREYFIVDEEHVIDEERIVFKLLKISQKSDNINTRIEVSSQSRIRMQFSQNNHTLKLKISKIQVQGLFLPSDQSQIQEKCKDQKFKGQIVQEQGAKQTVTPNVNLTDESLEVLDFDSFDSDVRDDTASITRRSLRKLRKTGGQSCGIVNTLFVGQEFPSNELEKARIKAYIFKQEERSEL
nr:transposase, MuDR [Tanacetum cinerariifolium]